MFQTPQQIIEKNMILDSVFHRIALTGLKKVLSNNQNALTKLELQHIFQLMSTCFPELTTLLKMKRYKPISRKMNIFRVEMFSFFPLALLDLKM